MWAHSVEYKSVTNDLNWHTDELNWLLSTKMVKSEIQLQSGNKINLLMEGNSEWTNSRGRKFAFE